MWYMCRVNAERLEFQFERSLHIQSKINNEKIAQNLGQVFGSSSFNSGYYEWCGTVQNIEIRIFAVNDPSVCVSVSLIPSMNRINSSTLAALFALKLYMVWIKIAWSRITSKYLSLNVEYFYFIANETIWNRRLNRERANF